MLDGLKAANRIISQIWGVRGLEENSFLEAHATTSNRMNGDKFALDQEGNFLVFRRPKH